MSEASLNVGYTIQKAEFIGFIVESFLYGSSRAPLSCADIDLVPSRHLPLRMDRQHLHSSGSVPAGLRCTDQQDSDGRQPPHLRVHNNSESTRLFVRGGHVAYILGVR